MKKSRIKRARTSGILAGFAVAAGTILGAIQAPAQTAGPIAPKAGQTVQKAPDKPQIRVRVNLVDAPAVVTNAKGDLVLDLMQKNFRVLDNGQPQRIEAFDMGGAPLSVAIVLEDSSRVEALLPEIRRTGTLFTEAVLGENGDAAVIGYDDQVNRLLNFTGDHDAIDKAISNLQASTSGAKLYDALANAVALLRTRPTTRRRVIIAVAEAADTGSEAKLGEVLRQAELANIMIYTVGLSSTAAALRNPPKQGGPPPITPPGTESLPPIPGAMQTPTNEELQTGNMDLGALAEWAVKHATANIRQRPLEVAAQATGGSYQPTVHDNSIEMAIDQIGGELHAQYVLSYRPTNTDAGGYHEIKVELVGRPGLKVRTRPGYYLGSDTN